MASGGIPPRCPTTPTIVIDDEDDVDPSHPGILGFHHVGASRLGDGYNVVGASRLGGGGYSHQDEDEEDDQPTFAAIVNPDDMPSQLNQLLTIRKKSSYRWVHVSD